jgi:deoxyribodipyrimidine photolyase-related protein
MGTIYATWDRMNTDRKKTILSEAEDLLTRLDKGETP